jgi:hypothetical protein
VAGRVDQVELVPFPGHPHGLGLYRDPAFALQIHRVEDLLAHLASGDGLGEFKHTVGQGRLSVVDVRDDREVANTVLRHGESAWGGAASQR